MNTLGHRAPLIDPFGRTVDYLRLSVTDRCNFRCNYCMAEDMTFLPRRQILSLEEVRDTAVAFVELGVRKIRLTGGEPLIRRDILKLVSSIARLPGLDELTMTTNGVYLPTMAQPLKDAGMSRINISIDSLRRDRFKELTRVGDLDQVVAGIDAAASAQFKKIKLFYTNGPQVKELNNYDTLNVIYKNQIICSKRN